MLLRGILSYRKRPGYRLRGELVTKTGLVLRLFLTTHKVRVLKDLEIATQCLLALDRLEQRLEIPFAETTAAAALDDLIEERRTILHRLGENLQQVPLFVLIHQNAQLANFLLNVLRQDIPDAIRQHVVVAVGYGEKFDSIRAQLRYRLGDALARQSHMLDARPRVAIEIFLNLTLVPPRRRLVDRKLHRMRIVGHDNAHQRTVFRR